MPTRLHKDPDPPQLPANLQEINIAALVPANKKETVKAKEPKSWCRRKQD